VNLHARQCVDGRDRRQLERLCRYITRPPLAQDRLELRPDGKIELTLKSVWKDGTRAILLPPRDLITRLIAAIPPPRFHLVRYFGVLSSHSKFRSEVIPKPPQNSAASLTFALPVNAGPGCWLMCSGQILTLVCIAVGPCAGSKPPPPYKLRPRCSLSLGLLLNLLRRNLGFRSGT